MGSTSASISRNQKEPLHKDRSNHLRKAELHSRKASFTPEETLFLEALLLDKGKIPTHDVIRKDEHDSLIKTEDEKNRAFGKEMIARIPDEGIPLNSNDGNEMMDKQFLKPRKLLRWLWKVHENGVPPDHLADLHARSQAINSVENPTGDLKANPSELYQCLPRHKSEQDSIQNLENSVTGSADTNSKVKVDRDDSSDFSWDENDSEQYDSWQVLRDEYAKDFGFDYAPDGTFPAEDEDIEANTFKILGTSADDSSAHPHVLSPPLIDAILNFVPEHLKGQNMWMKYSLMRDGADLNTLKQYAKASKNSILAIETTKGHVFGCYASQPWRTSPSFYGGLPSFVFKMRHPRHTPCHSLIEQAHLESEIDVFFLLEHGQRPQVCTHKMIGIGEGALRRNDTTGSLVETLDENDETIGQDYGFAIALQDDLLSGTTSKCSSFKNPCLVNSSSKSEAFEVLNLELWTFTPCFSLETAEKLEMTQYFVEQSIRNMSIASSSSTLNGRGQFSSKDLKQDQFYRRIGRGDVHEELRDRWQRESGSRELGASPRYSSST